MKKLLLFTFLSLFFVSFLYAQTVYITKTGKKYHTENCSYLRKSSIPIDLKDAVGRGYTPCSRCSPPILTGENRQEKIQDQVLNNSNNNSDDGRCQAITKAGTRCKRKAQPGSKYCWQHQPNVNNSVKSYSCDKTIYTGPRGGKYYYNSKGKKVYIKRR